MVDIEYTQVLQLWHNLRFPVLFIALTVVAIVKLRGFLIGRKEPSTCESPSEKDALPTFTPQLNPQQEGEASLGAKQKGPGRRITGQKPVRNFIADDHNPPSLIQLIVFYATLSGTTEGYAKSLTQALAQSLSTYPSILTPKVLDLSDMELDEYFTNSPKTPNTHYFYIVLFPTYDIDTNLTNFLDHLRETHYDFRVDTAPLSSLSGYAVLGFGDRAGWPTEESGFCAQAKQVDQWLAKLTAHKRAYPLGMIDTKSADFQSRIDDWQRGVVNVLKDLEPGHGLGEGVPGSGDPVESDEESGVEDVNPVDPRRRPNTSKRPRRKSVTSAALDDVENLGTSFRSTTAVASPPVDFTTTTTTTTTHPSPSPVKQMVPMSSPTHAALTKQGYTIVGSHSGVKICRWTKSALRGRGSCYKHSFYGIESHLCMEATPSLSCSNKCVFCWRHGTNPVGTTWRWEVDPPEKIFAGIKEGHYKKIKMLRGVPGVRAERFEAAMRIRHCALSLVGEPIFYPHINPFIELLHRERISTFLVCNAQHPAQLAALRPVTQLYLSVDASDANTLRKIDRPLHRDFWERFCACLDIVRQKRHLQRTVYRLTLVKGFNVEAEANGYADLVARGLPCFVEVKGVTYCGTSTSKSAGLTMQNVPFYEEVVAFVQALERALADRGIDYGIAAEHAHSCCILLADRQRFCKGGKWECCIDYQRFFELLEEAAAKQGGYEHVEGIQPEDYTASTPAWALWGAGGFDPRDERVRKKGKKAREERQSKEEEESGGRAVEEEVR